MIIMRFPFHMKIMQKSDEKFLMQMCWHDIRMKTAQLRATFASEAKNNKGRLDLLD